MKNSLGEYTIKELKVMEEPFGNKNYDVYDKIVFNMSKEFDSLINNDELIKENKKLNLALKSLTMFLFGYSVNKKNTLNDRAKQALNESLSVADSQYKNNDNLPYLKEYKQFRNCLKEYLIKSAHYDLDENKEAINLNSKKR